MKLLHTSSLLFASASLLFTSASPIIEQRDIRWPSGYIPWPVDTGLAEINSWTLAGLASILIGSAPSPTHLAYLCDNWASISKRYATAFSTTAGDVVEQARWRLCNAVTKPRDPALPINGEGGALFNLRGHLSGTLALQLYGANTQYNDTWSNYMCFYIEDRLLEGLWAWGEDRDTGEYYSAADVEASLCTSAGFFTKGDNTQYTEGPVGKDVQAKATVLVSQMLARVARVLVDSEEKAVGVCERLGEYKAGIVKMGLDVGAIEKALCGERKVDELDEAVKKLHASMSSLFEWQLLNGGSWNQTGPPEYRRFLCDNLVEEELQKMNLDGKKIKKKVCDGVA